MEQDRPHRPLGRRLLGRVEAFQYATVPNAPAYRAIMQVCYDTMQRYVIELRPDEILRQLRAGAYVVEIDDVDVLETQFLKHLERWGWGFYAELDGISTYHLIRDPDVPGVFPEWFVWDGATQ